MNSVQTLFVYMDGTSQNKIYYENNGTLIIPKEDVGSGVAYIDVHHPDFCAQTGDEGYFIVPNISQNLDNEHAAQIFFRKREDMTHTFTSHTMPIYVACNGQSSLLAVADGMKLEYELKAEITNGKYLLYPRYRLYGDTPYEDITIHFYHIDDTDWCAVARRYRDYQLDRGACKPLKERAVNNEVLSKAVSGIEIRVRHAWKLGCPHVPGNQTEENEPPLHVAVDFKRLEDVIDAFKDAGVNDAEFCLVGWNIGGHDGRFPDLLPVEPKLGGESALRHLTKKATNNGYLISAHTNPLLSFTISRRLDTRDFQRDRNGNNYVWGSEYDWDGVCAGGYSHTLCEIQGFEHYTKQDMKDLRDLGFKGLHYYDQTTIFWPRPCFDPNHPQNRRDVVNARRMTLDAARDNIGGAASEGGFDYCIGSCDYALYPVITYHPELPPICDATIPFWYIVYHGIVLYNAFSKTVNALLKGPDYELISVEHGARPIAYLHGRAFEYEGEPNFTCTTDEEMYSGVKKLAAGYKRYLDLCDLQYEFLDDHKRLNDDVVYTKYSDGTIIIVNYGSEPYMYSGEEVAPKSYLRTKE